MFGKIFSRTGPIFSNTVVHRDPCTHTQRGIFFVENHDPELFPHVFYSFDGRFGTQHGSKMDPKGLLKELWAPQARAYKSTKKLGGGGGQSDAAKGEHT